MTWPTTTAIATTNVDANTDNPSLARVEIKDVIDRLNLILAHISSYSQGLLDDTTATAARATLGVGIRGHLAGLTLTPAGASVSMPITAGEAADSTNTQVMQLAAAITKTTSAWAVGTTAGGLDTGTATSNTWYHWYLIKRLDTGVVDAIMSLSATAPTLPANYTLYRRIGSAKTNNLVQWDLFIQDGDRFHWVVPLNGDAGGSSNPGTAAVTRTITVPPGINVMADLLITVFNGGVGGNVFSLCTDLATQDTPPQISVSDTPTAYNGGGGVGWVNTRKLVRTNTSRQVRTRVSYSDSSVSYTLGTWGWIDSRGRDA